MGKLMTQKLSEPVYLSRKIEDKSLFSGFWIRWSYLSAAERVVCAIIVLLPLWWALGLIPYLTELLAAGVALYDWRRYKKLRLKRPSLAVVALLGLYAYDCVGTFLLYFDAHPLAALSPGAAKRPIDLVESVLKLSFPCLVWYIQSNNVRVRLPVVAWACSVSVVQSLAIWLVVHFGLKEPFYNPPRTLWAVLTGKSAEFYRGIGNSNYLTLYWPDDQAIAGVPRFYSFFYHPESLALFVGAVGILALDIKNRLWSVLLFTASLLLIGLSGTRSVWLAFPLVVSVRYLIATSKTGGFRLVAALIAIVSFVTLSLPPVTNLVLNTYTDTTTFISDFRENSTEQRGEIYASSITKSLDNPLNFLFGYKVIGSDGAGSHSFIMGDLQYQKGFIGTVLFMIFWAMLIIWLYRTRIDRPACSFLILLLLSFTFVTMVLAHIAPIAILTSMMLRRPAIKSLRRNASWYANS